MTPPTVPFLTPLLAPDLRGVGIPAPWAWGMADRVRFYEIDALGHVNNVAYLRWFETVRVRWTHDLGLREAGVQSVLRAQGCDYHAPMFLGDDYIVTTRCAHIGTTSLRMDYAVWSQGALKAEGHAVVVTVDASGTRKVPVPEPVRRELARLDGAADATA